MGVGFRCAPPIRCALVCAYNNWGTQGASVPAMASVCSVIIIIPSAHVVTARLARLLPCAPLNNAL